MLDREGAAGPADLAIVGDENQLRGQIKRFEDMGGATDFNAAIMDVEDGAFERTLEFLGQPERQLAKRGLVLNAIASNAVAEAPTWGLVWPGLTSGGR